MSERTRKILRIAHEMSERDGVNCSYASNDHEMPAISTQVTNISPSTSNHDQSNHGSIQWNVVQSTPTTMSLKKLDSSEYCEHCTTSDESDDVVSSGSGEMCDPSSSDESSSSNSSSSPPLTSNTDNAENQQDETQLSERSPTVRGKKEQEMSKTGVK